MFIYYIVLAAFKSVCPIKFSLQCSIVQTIAMELIYRLHSGEGEFRPSRGFQ